MKSLYQYDVHVSVYGAAPAAVDWSTSKYAISLGAAMFVQSTTLVAPHYQYDGMTHRRMTGPKFMRCAVQVSSWSGGPAGFRQKGRLSNRTRAIL